MDWRSERKEGKGRWQEAHGLGEKDKGKRTVGLKRVISEGTRG